MGAGQALERIEASVLRAASVRNFAALVAELRLLVERDDADEVLRRIAALTPPSVVSTLRAALIEAWRAGGTYALAAVEELPGPNPVVTMAGGRAAALGAIPAAVADLDTMLAAAVRQARQLAVAGAPADVVLAPLGAAVNRVRMTVTTSVHGVGNLAVTEVADLARLPTVWVAETDACVDCLAYSGRVADPGDGFPEGLTFARVPRTASSGAELIAPPKHPNCRCEVEPLGDEGYAEALRREAERSVLRGFSLESESMATRVEAASLLLQRGTDLPASVIRYAERAVGAGRFPSRT